LSEGTDDGSQVSALGYNLRHKLGYSGAVKSKKLNEINPMAASWLRSERTTLRSYVPLEELKSIKNSKGDPGQMATISECRYRWLRVRDLNLLADGSGRGSIAHQWRFLADYQRAAE
jgi:hypothetical protein